tara:strand:+ start:1441 stop:1554 length:114 start_codon:yes stop_codon:yes gene_type:complete
MIAQASGSSLNGAGDDIRFALKSVENYKPYNLHDINE